MTTPDPIRDALKQWIVVSRYSLGEAIRQAWLKHGQNSWCAIADEVISELAQPLPTPTPSLEELLTPDGGYELDAKHVHPSAQHIDGKWWAPRFGRESLGIAMDDIRYRILPHLRPPVVGIDLPGPDGDYAEIADLCRAEGVPIEAGARLLRRARAAWDSNRIPLTPLFYESEDGYCIFVDDRKEHDWQVSRYTEDGLYTPERLFANGEWSKDWHADNMAEYTFPTATAAWEALKKWQEKNHA